MREVLEPSRGEAGRLDPDVPEVALEIAGERWTARIAGRGRGGSSQSPVPLLLIRFHPGETPEPQLEALVVGRRLADMSRAQLVAALEGARPPRPDAPREIFPEAQERRRRRG